MEDEDEVPEAAGIAEEQQGGVPDQPEQMIPAPPGVPAALPAAPQPAPSLTKEMPDGARRMGVSEWLSTIGWSGNPFTFAITPGLYVGYNSQKERILRALEEKHKIILLIGATGSGKTTTLKWLAQRLGSGYGNGYDTVYIGKPPSSPGEFVHIFSQKYKTPWYLRPFIANIRSVYELPDFLNRKLGRRHLVVLYDEAHESEQDVLEWLRVLGDQVEKMSLVLAGLPVFDETLGRVETLRKRIAARIELLSLTKEDMAELIAGRIRSKGGRGDEFAPLLGRIYDATGGFPREVLRVCDSIVERAAEKGVAAISESLFEEAPRAIEPSLRVLDALTPTQREALEMLATPRTPGEIADRLDLGKYKSRQHAVRSMNNIMTHLLKEGFLERTKRERAFAYQLKPQFRSLVIKR